MHTLETLCCHGTPPQEAHMTMSDVANQINRVVKVQVRRRGEGGREEEGGGGERGVRGD